MDTHSWKVVGLYLVATTSASIMVIDSGAFYDQFSSITGVGYLQACLLEIALGITTSTWISKDRFGLRNLCTKILMISLFTLSIATATLQVALDEIETISKLFNQNKAVQLLETGIEESQKNQDWLRSQNQKLNTILGQRKLNENQNQLTEILLNQKSEVSSYLKIGSLLLVKILLQSSNLFLFYLVGRMRREKSEDLKNSQTKASLFNTVETVKWQSQAEIKRVSLKELLKKSKIKQSQIASDLNLSSSIVSVTIRNAEAVEDYLLNHSLEQS